HSSAFLEALPVRAAAIVDAPRQVGVGAELERCQAEVVELAVDEDRQVVALVLGRVPSHVTPLAFSCGSPNDDGRWERRGTTRLAVLVESHAALKEEHVVGYVLNVVMPPAGISPGGDERDDRCAALERFHAGLSYPLADLPAVRGVHEAQA